MDEQQLLQLISLGETLAIEFKSDRKKLSDNVIYEEVVALANTDGGALLLGVEDDGSITGAIHRHGTTTHDRRIVAAIFNNTVPNVNTTVSVLASSGHTVIVIEVPRSLEICATKQGRVLRRVIGPDGKPESIPYYPAEQRSRRIDLSALDFSAQTMDGVGFDDLDPLEFERLRQTASRLHGDVALLGLSNEELGKALRLVESRAGELVPNIAGLLLLGRETAIRSHLQTHEVRFQVLDENGDVKVNETLWGPVLSVISEIEARFLARNEEREVTVGLFRYPIPDYSPTGFREAVNNAILHRDYSQLGSVYIRWQAEELRITNPGGFPEGISLDNFLIHEPHPRNPRLAEAFRRIGLIEQTGRGIGKIYMGQLRFGRPAPDYSTSDRSGVRVVLAGGKASLEFATFVHEHEKEIQSLLSLDELMILNALFLERRIDSTRAGKLIQKGQGRARSVLESLQEQGLIEARGEKKWRVYHLSAKLYQRLRKESEYVRTRSFEPLQHEQMVLQYIKKHPKITRADVIVLCQLTESQASRLLHQLTQKHPQFRQHGVRRGTYYVWEE